MEIEDHCEIGLLKIPSESSKLPNEMVMEVLSYCELPTLFTWRLVSKNLNELASQICRKRSVQLNTFKWNLDPSEACSTFRDSIFVPWSSCTFIKLFKNIFGQPGIFSPPWTIWHEKERQYLLFFDTHGHSIKTFTTIGSTLRDIIDFLPSMPNLQVLMIYARSVPVDPIFNKKSHKSIATDVKSMESKPFYWTDPDRIARQFQFVDKNRLSHVPQLSELRKLYVDSVGMYTSPAFLEFISKQQRLEKVHLNYGIGITSQISLPASRLALIKDSFLMGIRYSKAGIPSVSFVLFNASIRLRKMVININAVAVYETLEKIFETHSETLQKLSIKTLQLESTSQRPQPNFRIPDLYALKFLKVQLNQNHPPHGFQNVTRFETSQFPGLGKVEFVNYDIQFEAFRNSVHETVQELVLHKCGKGVTNLMDIDWATVFPNLKKLVTNADGQNLQYIFTRMRELEYLDLIVEIPRTDWFGRVADASNINFIFSGIRNPSEAMDLLGTEMEKLNITRTNPSILDLNGLKSLKVKFPELSSQPRNYIPFDDSGSILSIIPLPRLHTLGLYNVQVSNKCAALIRARHEYVEIRQLHQPKYESGSKRGWFYNFLFGKK